MPDFVKEGLASADELDEQYQNELSKVKGRSVVVSHEAYGYLCDEFGLSHRRASSTSSTASRSA